MRPLMAFRAKTVQERQNAEERHASVLGEKDIIRLTHAHDKHMVFAVLNKAEVCHARCVEMYCCSRIRGEGPVNGDVLQQVFVFDFLAV